MDILIGIMIIRDSSGSYGVYHEYGLRDNPTERDNDRSCVELQYDTLAQARVIGREIAEGHEVPYCEDCCE